MIKGHRYYYRVRSERHGDKVKQVHEEYLGRNPPQELGITSTPKQIVDLTGLADRQGVKPSEVNQAELRKGIKVEMEHTKDRKVAKQIATDHLTENSQYYTDLAKMESAAKKRDAKVEK